MLAEARPPRKPRRRAWALLVLVILAALAYLAVLRSFDLAGIPSERRFETGPRAAQRLKIYVEPLSADPVNESMHIRIDAAPGRAMRGTRPDAPDRNLTVILTSGDAVEVRMFRANERMEPTTIRADLTEGSIARYPLDRYRIALRVQAFEGIGTGPGTGSPVAETVTVWEGMPGYHIRAKQAPEGGGGGIGLRFDLRRADAQIFFALAAYGAMAVVACSALAISFLVFLGRRKVETTLVSALAALIFALPALRNALPGAPPLGVRADLAVFLWAELAAVMSLALFVLSWARQGRDR